MGMSQGNFLSNNGIKEENKDLKSNGPNNIIKFVKSFYIIQKLFSNVLEKKKLNLII